MQSREPAGSTCDFSMYVRWAMARRRGRTSGSRPRASGTADGLLPNDDTPAETPVVSRGVGPDPRRRRPRPAARRLPAAGGIVFFGHDDGRGGHDAL